MTQFEQDERAAKAAILVMAGICVFWIGLYGFAWWWLP